MEKIESIVVTKEYSMVLVQTLLKREVVDRCIRYLVNVNYEVFQAKKSLFYDSSLLCSNAGENTVAMYRKKDKK